MLQPRPSIIDISEDLVAQISVRQAIIKGRGKAVRRFLFLALLQFTLGVGFLTCAGLAIKFTRHSDTSGPPYFVGAFITGFMILAASSVSFYVQYKGRNVCQTAIVKDKITCAITASYVIAILAFFSSFIGVVLVGIGGLCNTVSCHYDVNITENYITGIVILFLLLITLIKIVYQLCTTCSLGHYFGDVPESRRRMSRPTILLKDESGGDPSVYGLGIKRTSDTSNGIDNLAHLNSTISLDETNEKGNVHQQQHKQQQQQKPDYQAFEDPPTNQPSDPPTSHHCDLPTNQPSGPPIYNHLKVETPPPEYPGVFSL